MTLPVIVEELLTQLVQGATKAFGEDLYSIVLFGSGAEGKLTPTSDLNLLFVLNRFDQKKADAFREPLRAARLAGRAEGMFVLKSELPGVSESFAVKFDDIMRRHRILYGENPLADIKPSRAAKVIRLRQVLGNLSLRLREQYLRVSLREEQLAIVIAGAAGPLRASAMALLELERKESNGRDALLFVVSGDGAKEDWLDAVNNMMKARNEGTLPPGMGAPTLFALMEIAGMMLARSHQLPKD